MKKIIKTQNAPAPVGPYSQAVEIDGTIFCSGQVPIIPETGEVFTGNISEQTRIVMENVKAVLTACDLTFDHVVKTTIFLTSMSDFAQVNEVYGKYFASEPPARSCVAVRELPKGVNVEVEVLCKRF